MYYNPRFPHKLRGFRESLDENGDPVVDENGDPVLNAIIFKKVVCDVNGNPTRRSDGSFVTEDVTEMPWGYRTSTGGIKASGLVFETDFKVACPMFITHLEEGMVLELTDYNHTFSAQVQKCTTYNWGTNIWFVNPGNDAEVSTQ